MTLRRILCEGPEDLAAIREIGSRVFEATVERAPGAPGGSYARIGRLRTKGGGLVELVVPKGRHGEEGESHLPATLAVELKGIPIDAAGDDLPAFVAVVFDPDRRTVQAFAAAFEREMGSSAPEWALEDPRVGSWIARRGATSIRVSVVPWRSPDPVLDELSDTQSLDRLICAVASRGFGRDDMEFVERLLGEVRRHTGTTPSWKAAKHLWCAVRQPGADEFSAPVKFLGQDPKVRAAVAPALQAASLFVDLEPLLTGP